MVAACKIDHTVEGELPADLCRACHPELNTKFTARTTPEQTEEVKSAFAERFRRRDKRKARALVKTWRERVERMRKSNIDPRDMAKAEELLRKAEHALYLVA